MSESDSDIATATTQRDASRLSSLINASEFIMISIAEGDQQEEAVGALTAEVSGFEVLVAFTTEENAGEFVRAQGELFEDGEDVDGVVVEGGALLDHLPEGYGLLVDPETDAAALIEPSLAEEIKSFEA